MKIKEFKIEEGIIHVLDMNCDYPILNEDYLNLSNEEIELFLIKHIEKILKDDDLDLGKFHKEPKFISGVHEFLSGKSNLLEVSRNISEYFFNILVKYGGGASCDLLFLNLKTEFGNALCMIKLDYIKNYIHKIDYIDDKMKIDIIPQYITLPNISHRVNKACIFLKDLEDGFNLFFLDKLPTGVMKGNTYFKDKFLNCERILSNVSKTKDLISLTEKWTRKNIKDDADKAFEIRESFREKILNEGILNVKSLAKDIFMDDEDNLESFINFTGNNGLDGEVEIDKGYVSKKYDRIRLKIDKDIDLYINRDSFYDVNRFEVKRNGDGSINMTIKYIINYNEK